MIKPININTLHQTYCYAVSCEKCGVNYQICQFKDVGFTEPDLKDSSELPDFNCPKCSQSMK